MKRQQEKILTEKLKKQGIDEVVFYHFKLYYPDTYDKFSQQADINADIAVEVYREIIQASIKRV